MPATPQYMQVDIAPPNDPRYDGIRAWLLSALQISVPSGFLTGGIVSILPTQNIGPVLFNNQWYVWSDSALQYVAQLGIGDVGSVKIFAFTSLDTSKYLQCLGQAIPRTAPYNLLYAAIGTVFGSGDGSTTFNIPNLPQVLQVLASGQITLASGVGVINNSLITATSMVSLDIATKTGTVAAIQPPVCTSGQATITGGGSDNSTYNYIIYGVIAGMVYGIRFA